jgi:hypothetical protein
MSEIDDIQYVKSVLRRAHELDQNARKAVRESGDYTGIEQIDAANTALLKQIIAAHGWPNISTFGKEAAHQAWCLAQHADRGPAFQMEVLTLMHPLVALGEVEHRDYAYLYDRVAVNNGRAQHYGTQGYDHEGLWTPRPIEGLCDPTRIMNSAVDLAQLNARRAKAGIEPPRFEDYYNMMNEICAEPQPVVSR